MGEKFQQLSREERATIMVMHGDGRSIRAMARMLRRSPSTISREIARNRITTMYCADIAGRKTRERRYIRPRKLAVQPDVWQQIQAWILLGWSPLHIAGRLRTGGSPVTVSPETIYAMIYAQPRGDLRTRLIKALRQGNSTRRPRSGGTDRRGQIPDLRPIHERPIEANSRLVPGHWEGDLLKGKGNQSAVGSLVERTSRFTILVQLDDATSPTVTGQFVAHLKDVPPSLRRSLTYDRGKEMTNHKHITEQLGLAVYFADPHAPWQRGTNENTNGLVRQFLPKGSDLSRYSQADLNHFARLLNHRPRKCLGFKTPYEVYFNTSLDYSQPVAFDL